MRVSNRVTTLTIYRPDYDPSLPQDLIHLLQKCLAKNPDDRYDIVDIMTDEWVTSGGVQPLVNLPIEQKSILDNLDIQNDGSVLNLDNILNE